MATIFIALFSLEKNGSEDIGLISDSVNTKTEEFGLTRMELRGKMNYNLKTIWELV
jgi:hypothetical protein